MARQPLRCPQVADLLDVVEAMTRFRLALVAAAALALSPPRPARPRSPRRSASRTSSPVPTSRRKTNPTLPGTAVAFDGSCSRGNADIGWSSVPPDTWEWNFGDGTTASGTPTPTHTYARPGTYTVTLTESAEYGSDFSASHDVIVLG